MQKKKSNLWLIIFILLIVAAGLNKAKAQLSALHDYTRIDSIIIIGENNDTLLYPFAGGLNSCQIMNIDINLDGTDDLLVFDRHGYRFLPFLQLPAATGKYHFAPEYAALLPPVEHWIQTLDYNNNGKKDIFTYTTGGIKVFRNDSKGTLKFTQVTKPYILSKQGSTLTNLYLTYADYPAIVDLDGDGDLDILTFWGLGSFVELHQNTSVERFGNADSLTFEKVSSCWGHFAEGIESNAIIMDTCPDEKKSELQFANISDDPKHTGSTLLLNDNNGDGLPDLAIGDVDFGSLVQLTNGGTQADARMISQTTNFPNSINPVAMDTFPAAMLVDTDNDEVKDLIVSPFDPSLTKGENFESVSLYHNAGTNVHPEYNLVSKSFLQDQMLDFGSGAYPVFFDYNGDGLMDVLVGNYGYSDTCIYSPANGLQCSFISKIALLQNIGTAATPKFKLVDRNIAKLDEIQMQSLIPTLADLDGDGDFDLVCGNSKGKLVYCENVAPAGKPANFELVDPAWKGISVSNFSAPQLFDIDQDGLVDLVCGKRNGTLSYYRNTGTITTPDFSLITENFGGVDLTDTLLSNYGYSVPCFYKDKQGETLLFAGSEFGSVFVYDQINGNPDGKFHLSGIMPGIREGWRSAVALGNLNNDTLTDMMVGNYSGGLSLFYGKPGNTYGIHDTESGSIKTLLITPNPAVDVVSISIPGYLLKTALVLTIRGMDGKIIRKLPKSEFPVQLDISGLQNGIYSVTVQNEKGFSTGKLVICR